eukprot:CAMPEP_0176172052 /NCGR_PEP_ID=MMETSP0120_2-20121206/88126_1 /TAXON_ID=160619 /ORGANISM="Kryptoperidinium foliaceum, Strain CCMP 1326" /LENGTH=53 /DNA_ID=CAMNT_0017509985 /DNA_START=87 /DNA_END=245 /DNA_ORIENTATION=-
MACEDAPFAAGDSLEGDLLAQQMPCPPAAARALDEGTELPAESRGFAERLRDE